MSTMRNEQRRTVGIVGGVGPYAGLDLNRKVFASTRAQREQDHLVVYLMSCSSLIADRTEYLLDPVHRVNPGHAIADVLEKLSAAGAEVVGIPCNTSHCVPIFDVVERRIREKNLPVTLLHMIREIRRHVRRTLPEASRIGLLATRGTYHSGIYVDVFAEEGNVGILVPPVEVQEKVHAAVYHPAYGIKNHPSPVLPQASEDLSAAAEGFIASGAEAIIMGCTEIPLALEPERFRVPLVDGTLVLARALVEAADPAALLPL